MTTNSRFDLTNPTVIITGGGKGIGKVYAQEFARVGACVVAADIDEPAAKAVAEAIAAEGLARPTGCTTRPRRRA
jgi:NAD(P)-dependent dehydrogenase (short-subunit alcohol dehydrogenase family)